MSVLRFALIASSTLAFACGGAVTSIDDSGTDSGTDGSPASDSSSDAPTNPSCPANPPTAGATCSPESFHCEYGANPDPTCNQQFECTAGKWQNLTTGTICPPQSDCPATYASVPANQVCSPTQLACAYPDGECICTTNFGGLQMQTPAWDCFPAANGCPSPRPDIGAACTSTSNQSCDYGACSGGVALQCKDGAWQQVFTPCPD